MSNPHLEAVHDVETARVGAEEAAAPESASQQTGRPSGTQPDPQESKTRRGVPIWLFLLALIGLGLVIGWQLQVKGELEGEIAGLTAELRATQSLLGAHESRLGEIRSGVRDLTNQLAGLATLVEADVSASEPTASASGRESGASTGPGAPSKREIPARLTR